MSLRVRITDDRSGVAGGAVRIVSSAGSVTGYPAHSLEPRLVSGTPSDGVWEYSGTMPRLSPAGTWRIEEATAWDRIGRSSAATAVGSLPTFQVAGGADALAPSVVTTSAKWITASTVDSRAARTLRLRVRMTDDLSGLAAGGALWMRAPDGSSVQLRSTKLVSGTTRDGVWEFTGVLAAHSSPGKWKLQQLLVQDGAGRSAIVLPPVAFPAFTVVPAP